MKKTLFEEKTSEIWIKIDISKHDDSGLVVHGHDLGKSVQSMKQQDDYEYFLTISKAETQALKTQLGLSDDHDMIDWFIGNFSSHTAISDMKGELNKLGITYQFSTR